MKTLFARLIDGAILLAIALVYIACLPAAAFAWASDRLERGRP